MPLDRGMLEKHTREKWLPGFAYEVFDEMPLLRLLMSSGVQRATGTALRKTVVVGKNATSGLVSGYGYIVTQESDITQLATLPWTSYYYATVSISQEEEDEASGPEAVVDMLETKFQVAKDTLREKVNSHLYLALTEVGGEKTIVGLDAICHDSNTYANINRTVLGNEGWKSNRFTTVCTNADLINSAVPAKYFPSILRLRWLEAAHAGPSAPTHIIMTKTLYELLEYIGETAHLRFLGSIANFAFDEIKLGKQGLQGSIAPAIGWDAYCPPKRVFWLSPKNFYVATFEGRNFEPIPLKDGGLWREGQNQLAYYMPMVWKGQVLCTSPRSQATATDLGN